MSATPFNPRPSPWGFNDASAPQQSQSMSPEMVQLAHLPAALLSTLKREKKPFTYTPGGVDLGEVLSARLQRRLERKKRYCQEREQPPRQVVVGPVHNSALDMYSMENALEALEAQATLVAHDKGLDQDRSVPQSRAFKVLQVITDTDRDSGRCVRDQHQDEMRFRGLRDSKSIPSRFFQTLQRITGTDEDDEPTRPDPCRADAGACPSACSVQEHEHRSAPCLRRPAAFLPARPQSGGGFRPVKPPLLGNSAGTDF